jgi:hypothetical protein
MRTDDAVAYYGNRSAIAKVLGISRASVHSWGDLVPPLRAAALQEKSGGSLKFDPAAYSGYWVQNPKGRRRSRKHQHRAA